MSDRRVYFSHLEPGLPVVVIAPPDVHCDRDIVYGRGEFVGMYFARGEVRFDNGNGGYFPLHQIYPVLGAAAPEKASWREVSAHLRTHGWELRYLPVPGLPPYLWRSPEGMSGSEYRSEHYDGPPESVMLAAYKAALIGFVELTA